mgnify:CR=1 FL=1
MTIKVSNPSNRGNPSDELQAGNGELTYIVSNPSNRGNPSDTSEEECAAVDGVSQTPLTGAILPTLFQRFKI